MSSDDRASPAFIVYWNSLLELLQRCLTCSSSVTVTKKNLNGSALTVELLCSEGHNNVWRSQPIRNHFYDGNLKLAASVIFSTNTFTNIHKYFEMAGVAWISKSRFYELQKKYLFGVANEAWKYEQARITTELVKKDSCYFSGDGRCDSPGHNAKYLTYSLADQGTCKIVIMSLTQVTEAGNSNRMMGGRNNKGSKT